MKAVVLSAIRKIDVVEIPKPVLAGNRDVLLKVVAVGVCGSDVHYYTTGRIGCQVVKFPHRMCHECSAVVEQVGKDVRRVKPGDRVAVDPAVSCGKCDQCLANRRHTCRNINFISAPDQGIGCLAEHIVMPDENCYPVRPTTTFEQAALVEPLSIGLHSAKLAGPLEGARIAVLGCGPIGLSVILAARQDGAAGIYATDPVAARLAAAMRAGASWTGNPDKSDIVAGILQLEPLQPDVVFECCGQQSALDQAVELVKPGGKVVVVGIAETDRVSFSVDLTRRKEIRIQNVRRQNECVQPAIDLIEDGKLDVNFMVTHRFPIAETAKAFKLLEGYHDGIVKAMITP
jgi:L-iditol 2-dehydrogenase